MSEPILVRRRDAARRRRVIEQTRRLIAVVVDADGRLLGILSDGDIRRALLAGHRSAECRCRSDDAQSDCGVFAPRPLRSGWLL